MSRLERLLLDHAEQMILLVEPVSLRIVLANRVTEQMLGYTAEELCEKTILDVECALQDVFYWEEVRNGQYADIEAQEAMYLCADGSMRTVTKSVRLVEQKGNRWLLIQARDNAGKIGIEDDLAHTTSQLRATLESTGNGILVVDWQGHVSSMNRRFSAMWQIPEDFLLSQDDQAILDFVSSQVVDTTICHRRLCEIVEANETEDVLQLKDGRVFECKSLPQYLDERIIGRVFGFSDISERIRIEQDLIAARERAETANRAKAAFLAMMSHEIRTPMNGVLGMTTLLLDTPLNEEQKRYLDIIRSSSDALLTIINDILDFSKIEAQKLELESIDFDLLALLEDFSDLMGLRAAEQGLEFAWHLDPAVPDRLRGDPGRIRQILTNLIGNSLKFTPAGTVGLLVTRLSEQDDKVALQVEVRDTGIGIAADDLDKIFAPFEQADSSTTRKFGGTGLGLAITRQLVGLMQGTISVTSQVGQGTIFLVSLVLEHPREDQVGAEKKANHWLRELAGVRLLVVDDNEISRGSLLSRLGLWGFEVEGVGGGKAAIEIIARERAAGRPWRGVILDKSLADDDGENLGRRILDDSANAGMSLILCVPAGFRGDDRRFEQAGFSACLRKPVRQQVLLDCLQRVLGGSVPTPPLPIVTTPGPEKSARHNSRLLLVEDNAVNMVVVQGLLGKLGYRQFDKARDGLEAVEKASQTTYDLILMDCQMPKLDGYEATRRLREMGLRTPIIAMTAYAQSGDRDKCIDAGMDDYLSKPLALDALRACVEQWLPGAEES